MTKRTVSVFYLLGVSLTWTAVCGWAADARPTEGSGAVEVGGELKQWHKVTLTLDGPFARETDEAPNPFTDYRFTIVFRHVTGIPEYSVPGYFAADGNAANTSADAGTKWRAHLAPDKPGTWSYRISFVSGPHAAIDPAVAVRAVAPFDGASGEFTIAPTDKTGRDFRRHGRLEYVGRHYLQFAGSSDFFLKAGADAPETLLAYADFDGTSALKRATSGGQPKAAKTGAKDSPTRGLAKLAKPPASSGEPRPPVAPLKTWQTHIADWRDGDPTWEGGMAGARKGKGLIGALNYLAGTGCNAFSFLPYNVGGDGQNVWPFVKHDAKLHYDCSKLDQWQIVFDHAQQRGLYLHFKLQETEMDDNRPHGEGQTGDVPAALDGGDLGPERKLYCRELVARFGYELALNWNLGEENTQTPEQQRAMAQYIRDTDPYRHHIVIHTFPNQQDKVYPKLLGDRSVLTGASLQNGWDTAHQRTLKWVRESARAGRPWVVANDEQNPASLGVPPDPGYDGFDGRAAGEGKSYDLHDIRKCTLWGTLLAGGAGVEYYFGYQLPQNDLACEDWRSRGRSWEYCRVALDFFRDQKIPFWEMQNADELIGNDKHDNSKYCFAKPGELYLVYLPQGGTTEIDLSGVTGPFSVGWFDPRHGGPLARGDVREIRGDGRVPLGPPPQDAGEDWLIVLRKAGA